MQSVFNIASNGLMDDVLDVWIEEESYSLIKKKQGKEMLLTSTRVKTLL